MDGEKFSNKNIGILQLEFKKVYDRIEWPFLLMALKAFGFPNEFCKMVNTLLQDATVQVDINRLMKKQTPLHRSIR